MSGKLKIRLVKEKDLTKVSSIFVKVYTNFDVGEKWTLNSAKKLFKYYYKSYPDLFFVAEVDGILVGAFCSSVKPWWDGNHLIGGEVFVDPDYQRKGIATELYKKLYRQALKKYAVSYSESVTFKNFKFPLEWHKSRGYKEFKDWCVLFGNVKEMLKIIEKNSKLKKNQK
ncbi:MAG: GNAT family N-acetyltransferase [archaeon]